MSVSLDEVCGEQRESDAQDLQGSFSLLGGLGPECCYCLVTDEQCAERPSLQIVPPIPRRGRAGAQKSASALL